VTDIYKGQPEAPALEIRSGCRGQALTDAEDAQFEAMADNFDKAAKGTLIP